MNEKTLEKANELTAFIERNKIDLANLASLDDVDYIYSSPEIGGVWIDYKYIKIALILKREDIRLKLKAAEAELAEL